MPSRLFIYYNERVIEGTVGSDSGAQIRDGIKSVAKQGVCPRPSGPTTSTKFARQAAGEAATPTPQHAPGDLLPARAAELDQFKGCLADGFPFVFGFTVYESFESAGVAQDRRRRRCPGRASSVLGGHAVLAVGYDDATQRFLVRNSWGDGWGHGRLLHDALRLPDRTRRCPRTSGPSARSPAGPDAGTGGAPGGARPCRSHQRSDCGTPVVTAVTVARFIAAAVYVRVSWTRPFAFVTQMTWVWSGTTVSAVGTGLQ